MYVCRLDRPWLETDFMIQGFLIQSPEQIESLRQQCRYVFIDGSVNIKPKPQLNSQSVKQGNNKKQKLKSKRKSAADSCYARPEQRVTYINKISTEKEFVAAKETYAFAQTTAKDILNGIRIGRTIDLNQAKTTVNKVVDSILRNKDALVCLTRLKDKDEYSAEHSLNVSILASAFARHLGHDRSDLKKIALCGLLHDVGKAKIPEHILTKNGRLKNVEVELIKSHPTHGRNLLMSLPAGDLIAADVAHCHHERVDGMGYPRGLRDHQIPYIAKLISVVDCYDAITSNRCYDNARSSMEALDIIYRCRDTQIDRELAVEFIKCISIYAPGSIIELSDGSVGIILSTYADNRLKPKVLQVLNEKKLLSREKVIDLSMDLNDASGHPLKIKREIPNGTYGVELRTYLEKGLLLA